MTGNARECCLVISGGRRLEGRVALSGAKNAALPILAASLLIDGSVDLLNVPTGMSDVAHMLGLLEELGVDVAVDGSHVRLDSRSASHSSIASDLGGTIRSSILLLGPLLARFGKVELPHPGGCAIGSRPIGLHLEALSRFGGHGESHTNGVIASLPRRPHAAKVRFPVRTTGGTENALSIAVLAAGTSTIVNAHVRPEVLDLCRFLNAAGAKIHTLGAGLLEIEGVDKLHSVTHAVVPGDDEALTYLIGAAVTGGEIEIVGADPARLEVPLAYLRASGIRDASDSQAIHVLPSRRLTCLDVGTGPYPGINSDMQPFLVMFCTQAEGPSRVTDTRFSERFQYVEQLNRMGANIEVAGNTALVTGKRNLVGADVEAVDLRAGGALVLAGLCAEGETKISRVEQIDRGYEAIETKLAALGARVDRVIE